MAASISRVIVYGGKGALGREIVTYFKEKSWVSLIIRTFIQISLNVLVAYEK